MYNNAMNNINQNFSNIMVYKFKKLFKFINKYELVEYQTINIY